MSRFKHLHELEYDDIWGLRQPETQGILVLDAVLCLGASRRQLESASLSVVASCFTTLYIAQHHHGRA